MVCYSQWIKGNYSHENPIKFLTSSLKSSICDYSDAYILVTGNTDGAFKSCSPFRKCRTELNETFVDDADFINITMPMHNLIEYSDNYSVLQEVCSNSKEMKKKEMLI